MLTTGSRILAFMLGMTQQAMVQSVGIRSAPTMKDQPKMERLSN